MLNILLVDDEEIQLRGMEFRCLDRPNVRVVGKFTDSPSALEWSSANYHNIDAAILDIHMPGFSGIDLAIELNALNPNISIIFLTAYNEYAIEAFKIKAVNYLLKPISDEKFNKLFLQLEERQFNHEIIKAVKNSNMLMDFLFEQSNFEHPGKIYVKSKNGHLLINIKDIEYAYIAKGTRGTIVKASGTSYLCNSSLSDFLQRLPEIQFVQCHRSYIVNKAKIMDCIKNDSDRTAKLSVGESLDLVPVSRKYLQHFKSII